MEPLTVNDLIAKLIDLRDNAGAGDCLIVTDNGYGGLVSALRCGTLHAVASDVPGSYAIPVNSNDQPERERVKLVAIH